MTGKETRSGKARAPRDRVAGRPLADIRAILRFDTGKGFSLDDARQVLPREDRDTVKTILADLVTEGLLVEEKGDVWRCTTKGRDLQSVSRSRLSRANAEQLLAKVVNRVGQINADDSYAWRVSAIVVFGSFLSDKPMIGDIDLALQVQPRFDDPAEQEEATKKARARAVNPRNIAESVSWPRAEVERALKARSSVLEIHGIQLLEGVLEQAPETPFRVVFGSWAPTRVTRSDAPAGAPPEQAP